MLPTLPVRNYEPLEGLISTERDMSNLTINVYFENIPIEEVGDMGYKMAERTGPYKGSYYLIVPLKDMPKLKTELLLASVRLIRPSDAGGTWLDMERI